VRAAVKISVIGIGKVGSTVAFVLAEEGLASELVLWNRNHAVARANALDIEQACAFTPYRVAIRAGEMADTAGSDMLLMCASIPTPPAMVDRRDLAVGNAALMRDLVPRFAALSPDAVIVNVTNPVDAITWHILRLSGFPWQRVIGTGTLVDSARFRDILSEQVGIHPVDIRAYILGEHGDSQFAALSIATAGGEHIDATPARYKMLEQAKQTAFEVLRGKGYTNYAVAMAARGIVEAVVRDLCATLPVSVRIGGFCGVTDVCLSIPVVVGRGGVHFTLSPDLSADEQEAFRQSASVVRKTIETIDHA
jgi:L-lactate dehydrogenase